MNDFAIRLKNARQQSGVSLREIAAATKISVTALEALERGDYSRLPGGIFSRAFMRAYALQVGLEPEATVREFVEELNRFERESKVAARVEVTPEDRDFLERQRRARLWLKLGVAALVLLIAALAIRKTRALWNRAAASTTPATVAAPK